MLCASHGPADNVPSHWYTLAKRRRGKKMSNLVSFALTVPAMPCGHRGGDGVAGVDVTPRSTELLSLHPSVLHGADAHFGR